MATDTILVVAMLAASAFSSVPARAQAKKQPLSPPAETSVTIHRKQFTIKYSAPSRRGRQIFGKGGRISKDATYPVWRAGADNATSFHTDADIDLNGLLVPAGDHTIFVLVSVDSWELIINKQTGQWGLTYSQNMDLGRLRMTMVKPPEPIETFKITLTSAGGNKGKLQLEWENVIASVPFTVK